MHKLSSSFVLGYHGCDKEVAEKLLSGNDFTQSQNEYDWLGPGVYFWEANPQRGLEYAALLKRLGRGKIRTPAVVGAVIDLGLCLDLTTSTSNQPLIDAHRELKAIHDKAELTLPTNSADMMRRDLDCAVIRTLHQIRENAGEPPIDTIKGAFIEGEPIYPDSGFRTETHIQICARTPQSVKGVFRVRS
ncbi:MAG: hypothetical protein AMXMBFR74_20560 [Parvibaculum sp.]|uniref:hypothetical protein n=1 Tax=Parvibaculum sp. TaxID=2024848 RepID=UPI0035BAE826